MEAKHQTTPHSGVLLCHRCGWPFPNPHPSARHRRAHKKICGTIEGYTTNLIGSEVVSDDDEHHPDDDKEKTPSPKIEKKKSGDGGIRVSFSRSEDDLFSDAVTEFSDSGSANKSLDKDLFFSFKDAENDEISKVDTGVEVSEKIDTRIDKSGETEITTVCDPSESNLELIDKGLVKDGVMGSPEPSHMFHSQETKSIDVTEAGEEKGQESQTSETSTKEAKDSELTKTSPEVSEDVNEYETVQETNIEKFGLEYKITPEVVRDSATVQSVSVLTEKEDFVAPDLQIQEGFKEPVAVLIEEKVLEAHELGKNSIEQIQEVVKEHNTILTEKEDLGGSHLEKQLNEDTHEVFENPKSVLTEKQDLVGAPQLEKSSKEQIQEVAKQPDTVLTGKEDLDRPHLEEQSNEHNHEVEEKPDLVLTGSQDTGAPELEKCLKEQVKEPNLILTEKEDFGALKSEKCSKDEVIEQKVDNDCSVVADVSIDNSVVNGKNAADVVHVPIVEEEGKMNNQDSGRALSVDSSSRSSLEGNWGSVSVLSTASFDAGTLQSTEKSKVNSGKSNAAAAASDVFEPPSFMTVVVETESKDKKPESSEVQDSQKQPYSEAGWFPATAKVNNESEGRKRNEEAIAKVTNWSTGKQSLPLKNLLGEAKPPSGAQPEPVVQKDEAVVKPSVNDDVSSPPKLIDGDGKKGKKKKVKGMSSWVPFACCSSVNVVN